MAEKAVNYTFLLFLGFSFFLLVATQNSGCASISTGYALSNLRNVSVGISNVGQLRDLALLPLIAQPRVSGTEGNDLARTHIKTWMSSVGWSVEEDSFYAQAPYPYGNTRFSNIIATLDPRKPRRLVLACHYDSKAMYYARFVGATDSAVPCSLLMDSALRLLDFFKNTKHSKSDLTVQFIFFDGEEAFVQWSRQDSLYGSRHLAAKWSTTQNPSSPGHTYLQSIDTFILLDLIGTPDTHFKVRFPNTVNTYNKLLNIELCLRGNNYLNPTYRALFTPQHEYSFIEDDHLPFLYRGVPVVHLITSPFPTVWHTPSDDIQALDFNRIDDLSRILRVFLVDLPL